MLAFCYLGQFRSQGYKFFSKTQLFLGNPQRQSDQLGEIEHRNFEVRAKLKIDLLLIHFKAASDGILVVIVPLINFAAALPADFIIFRQTIKRINTAALTTYPTLIKATYYFLAVCFNTNDTIKLYFQLPE